MPIHATVDSGGRVPMIQLPQGLGGSTAIVDFGAVEDSSATVTVTGKTWVTTNSVIQATPLAIATDDHDPDDYAAEGISCIVSNIVPGVGFDIIVSAPTGTFGKYVVGWRAAP